MATNDHKSIILGVTGCIGAYKAADLCSKLTQSSYDVHVVMTSNAMKLVGELTFQTLSRNRVISSLWDSPEWEPRHTSLADKCALLVVAPCTASMMAKLAYGIADDALSTLALAHDGALMIAPAMNPRMWRHLAVQQNVSILKQRGAIFIEPGTGVVACGDYGTGRLEDIPVILEKINEFMKNHK
ncbi:MAG: flavoprotein [Victivallaceae bacterium]|nr:flavoprotein [Victivallaceae bacterium]